MGVRTFSLEEAVAFMFCTFVSFNAARETFTSISFVVMLLPEPSVKESDSNRKDQIYPFRTATYDAPWSFLLGLIKPNLKMVCRRILKV